LQGEELFAEFTLKYEHTHDSTISRSFLDYLESHPSSSSLVTVAPVLFFFKSMPVSSK